MSPHICMDVGCTDEARKSMRQRLNEYIYIDVFVVTYLSACLARRYRVQSFFCLPFNFIASFAASAAVVSAIISWTNHRRRRCEATQQVMRHNWYSCQNDYSFGWLVQASRMHLHLSIAMLRYWLIQGILEQNSIVKIHIWTTLVKYLLLINNFFLSPVP